ncbi:MAG: Gfo/Idh/MocA family oxidoreductase [Clostridia bacterium]|nr:Gfo/Idh/MocA family oxidoreductase [Clostridia bacterium]
MFKVCIISCGMITNSAHIPAYKNFPEDFEITAVCDTNEEAAKGTAERHGIPRYYTDAEKMLREEKPDVVSVCVPNFLHKKMTMLALSYGCNVMCEKPVAYAYDDAKEMYDYAKKQGKLLIACQSMRFTPDRLAAKKLIDEGKIGDIYYGEFKRVRRRGIPTWGKFHIKEFSGGGAFVDIGVHMVDSVIWLMGNPKVKSVSATTSKHFANEIGSLKDSGALTGEVHTASKFNPDEMNVEDFSCGTISFYNGARVNFVVSWAANLPEASDIVISGQNCGISLPDCKMYSGADKIETLETKPNLYEGEAFSGHFYLMDNLRKVLKGEEELIVTPEETINVAKILEGIYKSAEIGKEVIFDD